MENKKDEYWSEEEIEEIFRLNDLQDQQNRRNDESWMNYLKKMKSFWDGKEEV
jgi:hypothetical protein